MDIRWKQRFDNYKKALSQIKEGVEILQNRPLNNLEKQGVIQAFEYTFHIYDKDEVEDIFINF